MINYLAGHEPIHWDPDPEVSSHRFALGETSRASVASPRSWQSA